MRRSAAIGLILLLAIAGFLARPSSAQTPTTETITVKETSGKVRWIEIRPQHLTVGDVEVARFPLHAGGETVGVDHFVCTVTFGHVNGSNNMLCTDELTITGRGRIEAQGIIHLGTAPDALGISGGTGDFTDVAGTIHRTGPGTTVTITLIYH